MPAITIPAIAAGAQLAGAAINAMATSSMNKKTRKWNERMYDLQRRHAIEDRDYANQYNSVEAQMGRLKAAGLNPHLVYGDGNAVQSSSPVRSANAPTWNPEVPNIGAGVSGAFGSYFDASIKQNTIDNFALQREILTQEKLLRMAQVSKTLEETAAIGVNTQSKSFDLDLKKDLRSTSLEMMNEELRKLKVNNDVTLRADERAAALNASTIAKAAEEILNLRSQRSLNDQQKKHIQEQIDNLQRDRTLKDLDIELKRNGIQPGDAMYWRILGRIVGRSGVSLSDK